jgi:elongation factor G
MENSIISLIGHSGVGKTSLSEQILFFTGSIQKLGSVNEGNTISDTDPEEISRKMSINASILHCQYNNRRLYFIDTPGFADFIGETISAMSVSTASIVVVCGINGPEVGTERVWTLCNEKKLPRIICVNRMDKENSDFIKILNSIRETFGKNCVAVQIHNGKEANLKKPIDLISEKSVADLIDKDSAKKLREQLIEAVAESDDTFVEKYLSEGTLTEEELRKGLEIAVKNAKIFPVVCTSCEKQIGIKELLELSHSFFPPSIGSDAVTGKNPNNQLEEKRSHDDAQPFCAQVFKTISDPYIGQLSIARIYSGKINANGIFLNSTKGVKEKFGTMYLLQGRQQVDIQSAGTGDIIAIPKLKETSTGDTLCDEKAPIVLPQIPYPEPIISFSVQPKTRADEEKISLSLSKIAAENPTVRVGRDPQTKELLISGLGDMQIETVVNKLKRQYNVEVVIGTPKVGYKETILAKAEGHYRHKKQSGGAGQFGEVWLRVEPLSRGAGFEFAEEIFGGSISAQYVVSCEKGIRSVLDKGVIAGYPVVDVKAIVYDGKMHPVDSKDIAFQIAARQAFKEAFKAAKPVLLEPIMEIEIVVPDDCIGAISGDINGRRGRILGVDVRGRFQIVKAAVPLAEVLRYASELRSMTQGRGSYSMKTSHYEEVPQRITQGIIEKAVKVKEEEEE